MSDENFAYEVGKQIKELDIRLTSIENRLGMLMQTLTNGGQDGKIGTVEKDNSRR